MENWIEISTEWLNNYCASFKNLNEQQQLNFEIKREHSLRVARLALLISTKLQWDEEKRKTAYLAGILHDIGRFRQLEQYNTFDDKNSVDHAELGLQVLNENNPFEALNFDNKEPLLKAILNHNKFKMENGMSEEEMLFSKLLRDADKLDILKVLTDHYTNKNGKPNHTLTWNLPRGNSVSKEVAGDLLAGRLVAKENLVSEIDVKVMQLSWVYDLNFRQSFEILMNSRYLEIIYNSLPKNDMVIEIYRKIKVFAENKMLV
jgi:putative nucleotidyltransferase with HDIG domain